MKKRLNIALQELESAGIRDVERANGGKHLQLRWRVNGGTLRVYSMPATPSDWRASRNTRADVRRLLREDGVLTERAKPQPVTAKVTEPTAQQRLTALEQPELQLGATLETPKSRRRKKFNEVSEQVLCLDESYGDEQAHQQA